MKPLLLQQIADEPNPMARRNMAREFLPAQVLLALQDIGASPHRDEVFMVKVEIDTNPPVGTVTETRLLRR